MTEQESTWTAAAVAITSPRSLLRGVPDVAAALDQANDSAPPPALGPNRRQVATW